MNCRRILIAVDNGPTAEKVAIFLRATVKADIALVSVIETTFLMAPVGL